jgi:hypothetical protein
MLGVSVTLNFPLGVRKMAEKTKKTKKLWSWTWRKEGNNIGFLLLCARALPAGSSGSRRPSAVPMQTCCIAASPLCRSTYPFGEHRFYPRDIVNCDDFTECG